MYIVSSTIVGMECVSIGLVSVWELARLPSLCIGQSSKLNCSSVLIAARSPHPRLSNHFLTYVSISACNTERPGTDLPGDEATIGVS